VGLNNEGDLRELNGEKKLAESDDGRLLARLKMSDPTLGGGRKKFFCDTAPSIKTI